MNEEFLGALQYQRVEVRDYYVRKLGSRQAGMVLEPQLKEFTC